MGKGQEGVGGGTRAGGHGELGGGRWGAGGCSRGRDGDTDASQGRLRKLEIRNFEIDSVEMVELITMHTIEELKMSEGNFGNVKVSGNLLKITDKKDEEMSYKLP